MTLSAFFLSVVVVKNPPPFSTNPKYCGIVGSEEDRSSILTTPNNLICPNRPGVLTIGESDIDATELGDDNSGVGGMSLRWHRKETDVFLGRTGVSGVVGGTGIGKKEFNDDLWVTWFERVGVIGNSACVGETLLVGISVSTQPHFRPF